MRQVIEQLQARPSSDGDGVKLLRVFGGAMPERFDPFLLMDEFGSESAEDYIGGFPSHPHRGFSTITYMLQGKMEHRDHMGNIGLLNDGDVQWMTAGKGVIHSEMPKQSEGKMRGFQVWLNLPSKNKLQKANYEDVPHQALPKIALANEAITGKAIAGKVHIDGEYVEGYFDVAETEAIYLDLYLGANTEARIDIPDGHRALVYSYEGMVEIGQNKVKNPMQTLSVLSDEGSLALKNPSDKLAKIILLAGKPLKESIAQYGPFVMNTMEEVNQAILDYREGVLTD
ncbi:MAG: pirin family protein [Agarilytica sp.]